MNDILTLPEYVSGNECYFRYLLKIAAGTNIILSFEENTKRSKRHDDDSKILLRQLMTFCHSKKIQKTANVMMTIR